jgi:hypothetical protein
MKIMPTWKSGIRVTNSIIYPIGPDGRNTDNMHWNNVSQLPLGALSQDTFIRTLDGQQAPLQDPISYTKT